MSVLLLATLLASGAAMCKPEPDPQFEFDYSEVVFEGTVVGHVGDVRRGWPETSEVPRPPGFVIGPAGALLVVPSRAVNLPLPADTIAVMPSGLGSMCEPVFRTLRHVADTYPTGTRLAITGHPDARPLAGVPLVHALWDDVLVETDPSFDPWPLLAPAPDGQSEARYTFEFLRDLLALDRATTRSRREDLLVKVFGYWGRSGRSFSLD